MIPRKAVHDFFAVRDFSGFSKFLAVKKEKAKKALPSIPLMSLKKEALTLWSMKTKSQRKVRSNIL